MSRMAIPSSTSTLWTTCRRLALCWKATATAVRRGTDRAARERRFEEGWKGLLQSCVMLVGYTFCIFFIICTIGLCSLSCTSCASLPSTREPCKLITNQLAYQGQIVFLRVPRIDCCGLRGHGVHGGLAGVQCRARP